MSDYFYSANQSQPPIYQN